MYTEFYNLKDKPFNLSPSSKYLYLGDIHKEALALLTYGVVERMGFILLTGEVGTGKTTMVHALLNSLGDDVQCVYLSNPLLSVNDFMDYLAFSAFKRKVHFQSKADFLIQFEAFLKERLQSQKNFILIIDEAQKLSIDLLEEIRLLSNMETADEKLINIFLIGQPELNDTLSQMECRPLLQRISVRYHIKPLELEGTRDYLKSRLDMAGAKDTLKIFPKNTIKEIFKYSGGYPRMINILADNLLLLGYSREEKKLTPAMVKECYNDLNLANSFFDRQSAEEKNEIKLSVTGKKKRAGGRMLFIILLVLIALFAGAYGRDILNSFKKAFYPSEEIKYGSNVTEKKSQDTNKAVADTQILEHNNDVRETVVVEKGAGIAESGGYESRNEIYDEKIVKPKIDDPSSVSTEDKSILIHAPSERAVIIKPGETLAELALTVYGYVNNDLLDFLKKQNPDIEDINLIEVGQIIKLPPLGDSESSQIYTIHIASFAPFEKAKRLFNDLIGENYEVYIMPVYDLDKEKVFRITVGSFNNKQKADAFATDLLDKGVTGFADVIKLETR